MKNSEKIIFELQKWNRFSEKKYRKLLNKYPKNGSIHSKDELLDAYRQLVESKTIKGQPKISKWLQMKPTRTLSGVVPVTVLTKPYPCPGNCIFCPTDIKQPKSYLSSEPGAARALANKFDPFSQVYNRLRALENIGHDTEKIELIILGGTWSSYPIEYQKWFIKRCFDALNTELQTTKKHQFKKRITREKKISWEELAASQKENELSKHRCVGLVLETRPDYINEGELIRFRKFGVTKIQLGVQTLSDRLLKLNKRVHTVKHSKKAVNLIRQAGFKIHLHWMVNLYGSNPQMDLDDFKRLFSDKNMRPDELKIYPCSILKGTKLYELYKKEKYIPYTEKKMLDLIINMKKIVPEYCRISRLIRDIPSTDIVDGLKKTNFRQIVQNDMKKRGEECRCIRCREIRNVEFKMQNVELKIKKYLTNVSEEYFLHYVDKISDKILGFLRLSIPIDTKDHFIEELKGSAIIREVHVYGRALKIEDNENKNTQHTGFGKKLVKRAEKIAKKNGFKKVSVISAIGTKQYYRKFGYEDKEIYMSKSLLKS